MSEKAAKVATKTRNTILRKQNWMYMSMVISGMAMIVASSIIAMIAAGSIISNNLLLTNGIAFIIVGFVGLVMSWTTMDIGSSLKEAIKSANDKTLTKLDGMEKSLTKLDKLDGIEKSLTKLDKLEGIEKSLTKLDKLDGIAQSLESIKEILEKK